MEFNDFKSDKTMENEGVWRNCGKGRILIASTSSDNYKAALKEALQPYEMAIALGSLDDATAEDLLLQAEAKGLVLDWDGFTENGAPCSYSVDNAKRLMKQAPRLREWIKKEASSLENFRAKKEAAEVKN